MSDKYVVGEGIASWCTKCKLVLGHTIAALKDGAPKKVRCNTCNGNHNYREKGPEAKAPRTPRKPKKTKYEILISQLEDDFDFSRVKKYSMKGNFKADQVINHASFGIGFIVLIINRNKIDILFKDGLKRLVQNL